MSEIQRYKEEPSKGTKWTELPEWNTEKKQETWKPKIEEMRKKELTERVQKQEYTSDQLLKSDKDLFEFTHDNYLDNAVFNDTATNYLKAQVEDSIEAQWIKIRWNISLRPFISQTGVKVFEVIVNGKIQTADWQLRDANNVKLKIYFWEWKAKTELQEPENGKTDIPEEFKKFKEWIKTPPWYKVFSQWKLPDGRFFVISAYSPIEKWATISMKLSDGTVQKTEAWRPNKAGFVMDFPEIGTIISSLTGTVIQRKDWTEVPVITFE